MAKPERVPPEEARRKVEADEALLVCAYESDEKLQKAALEGAIPFSEFRSRLSSLDKNQELIFY